MRGYGYLRASTEYQDASRAKNDLIRFATNKDFSISSWFIENESGTKLHRPKLFRLLEIAESGDVFISRTN